MKSLLRVMNRVCVKNLQNSPFFDFISKVRNKKFNSPKSADIRIYNQF